jgi:hypothetical protein
VLVGCIADHISSQLSQRAQGPWWSTNWQPAATRAKRAASPSPSFLTVHDIFSFPPPTSKNHSVSIIDGRLESRAAFSLSLPLVPFVIPFFHSISHRPLVIVVAFFLFSQVLSVCRRASRSSLSSRSSSCTSAVACSVHHRLRFRTSGISSWSTFTFHRAFCTSSSSSIDCRVSPHFLSFESHKIVISAQHLQSSAASFLCVSRVFRSLSARSAKST